MLCGVSSKLMNLCHLSPKFPQEAVGKGGGKTISTNRYHGKIDR